MDRRNFIGKGLLAAGGLSLAGKKPELAAQEPAKEQGPAAMKCRKLGKTGLEVSEVSFGTFGWQNTPVLEAAIKSGLNLVCTCQDYQNGNAEKAIAPLLAKYKGKLFISTGCDSNVIYDEATLLKKLDRNLANLGTEKVDIFLNHMVETVEQAANPAIPKAFEKMHKAGKADHLGISTHGGALEGVLDKAIDLGYFEVIECKYNFMEHPAELKLFEKAAAKGIGIIVFKTSAGSRENEVKELEKKGLEYKQAVVRWALSNPNVSSVCVAFSNFTDVDNYLEAVNKKLSLKDRELLELYRTAMAGEYCRYCGTCSGICPYGVDIARVMRYQMYFKYYGFQKVAMENYRALPDEIKPLRCEDCDAPCQGACPHGLATRKNLLEARELLTLA